MKVLILDNYDSFTYNLYQYSGELLEARGLPFVLDVVRNDELSLSEIKARAYDRIIISPGPGDPAEPCYFGVCREVILNLGPQVPILGVCLGLQGIAQCYGGRLKRATHLMHGKTSVVSHTGEGIFAGLPAKLEVMRYHSLVVDPANVPESLRITATVEEDHTIEIMGLQHVQYPTYGIQFHPESFATEGGKAILDNFLSVTIAITL